MLINWKDSSLRRITATCLATPFLLVLVAIDPILGNPKQELQLLDSYLQKLPLGEANLNELRQTAQVAPGVTHTVIVRGKQSEQDVYTVDVAFLSSPQSALDVARQLKAQGYQPEIKSVLQRAPDDPEVGPLGYLVRVGAFAIEAEAISLREQLIAVGYTGLRVVNTGEDGRGTTGPWVVNVLEVDPKEFKGKVNAALATNIVPDNEPLTSIAARTQASAAINGGYFVIGTADGTPGDLAGIFIIRGNLVSEAVNGRTTLLLQTSAGGKEAQVATLKSEQIAIAPDGANREVDGLNRKPGLIRGCGGVGGDEPTQNPKHDFTCTDSSELIAFTPVFGQTTELGEGVEVTLDASGRVVELRQQRGGQIPKDGLILSGTGDAAAWLQTHARPGIKIEIKTRVLADGKKLILSPKVNAINGGPRLLRNGEVEITAFAEGFHWQENPEFYYRFGVRRNPRTLAGVTTSGKLVLVTVDGRRPGWSVGASFRESALIMRSLGAVDAVNLDGGGSTTLSINQQLVNRPSDTTGERPIGDAIIIQP